MEASKLDFKERAVLLNSKFFEVSNKNDKTLKGWTLHKSHGQQEF